MKTINGQLADLLFKGAVIILVRNDRIEADNRLLVQMPRGILAEDGREVKFKQFIKTVTSNDPDPNYYWEATNYFCNLRDAKKLFENDVQEDRLSNLRIEKLKKKNLQ